MMNQLSLAADELVTMATPSEDADDYNQLVAKIAGLSKENTDYENLTPLSVTPSSSSDDLVLQLQQKELDLKLTAELGKALLEKNEELKRRNEQLVEEFSQRLEVRLHLIDHWTVKLFEYMLWS